MNDNIKNYDYNSDVQEVLMKLDDLYTRLLLDLEKRLGEIGGTLVDFSPIEGSIEVNVASEHKATIQTFIAGLIDEYNAERASFLKADPFLGIKALLAGENP